MNNNEKEIYGDTIIATAIDSNKFSSLRQIENVINNKFKKIIDSELTAPNVIDGYVFAIKKLKSMSEEEFCNLKTEYCK